MIRKLCFGLNFPEQLNEKNIKKVFVYSESGRNYPYSYKEDTEYMGEDYPFMYSRDYSVSAHKSNICFLLNKNLTKGCCFFEGVFSLDYITHKFKALTGVRDCEGVFRFGRGNGEFWHGLLKLEYDEGFGEKYGVDYEDISFMRLKRKRRDYSIFVYLNGQFTLFYQKNYGDRELKSILDEEERVFSNFIWKT